MSPLPSTMIIFFSTLLFFIHTSNLIEAVGDNACLLKPDPGLCRGSFQRWFYDHVEKKCSVFTWGGCDGVVPFETEAECETAMCTENKCVLEPVPGPCRGSFPKWYYDKTQGNCVEFIWGGCQGVVPFDTEFECVQARCNPACTQIPETGPCKALYERYFFNAVSCECEAFTWGGCEGVVPFETLDQCQQAKCHPSYLPSQSPTTTPTPSLSPSPSPAPANAGIPSVCQLTPDSGICLAYFESYYWDNKDMQCKKFIWGGCGGTRPFKTEAECENAGCYTEDKCALTIADVQPPPDIITCQAVWTSWYFDVAENTCKPYTYSGCSNLGPFQSEDECVGQCLLKR